MPARALEKPVAADIRAIFDAPDEVKAKRLIARFIETYQHRAPKLAQSAETALPEDLAVLTLPPPPPATAYIQRDRGRQP